MTQTQSYAGKTFTCDDRRADGNLRRVRVEADHVAITRRYKGIAMRLAVPVAAFRGIALSVHSGMAGAPFYEVTLLHDDADLSVVLAQAANDQHIAASWQGWSAFFAMPRLVERRPGVFERFEEGPEASAGTARRRCSLTRQRRSRFAARRKPGQSARMEQRFDGERELIARD